MRKNVRVNDSFIANSLRNSGYNNYTAIADIIDNSLEPEVGSSFVRVDFEKENKGNVKAILIIDDGSGMTPEILEEAMALGSETGKNCMDNLGMYGTGLKSASLSIGQVLEVFTKTDDAQALSYAKLSIEDAVAGDGEIYVDFQTYSLDSQEFTNFKTKVKGAHGTVVKISSLDRLSNNNYQNFKAALKNKLGEFFNKFIYSDVVRFYVEKTAVPYVDLMATVQPNILMGEGEFTVENHNIRYKAFYLPLSGGAVDGRDDETHAVLENGTEYTDRTSANQGLYVYRNNRLVGKALTLGLWSRHSIRNGFRCEVYIDGGCDYLFGSTFTKMVSEKSRDNMNQELLAEMAKHIAPFATEAQKRQETETKNKDVVDPEQEKFNKDFYKKVADKQNKNMMLKANRKPERHPKDETDKEKDEKEKKPREKKENQEPQQPKEKNNKWLGGFEERPLGRHGEMYTMEHIASRPIIIINTDHEYYKQFYSRLSLDLKFLAAQIISCEEIAKQNCNYYNSDEIRNVIDCFNDTKSSEVMKSLCY